jgi:hypothetical protein
MCDDCTELFGWRTLVVGAVAWLRIMVIVAFWSFNTGIGKNFL